MGSCPLNGEPGKCFFKKSLFNTDGAIKLNRANFVGSSNNHAEFVLA